MHAWNVLRVIAAVDPRRKFRRDRVSSFSAESGQKQTLPDWAHCFPFPQFPGTVEPSVLAFHYFFRLPGIQVVDVSTERNRLELKPGIQRQIDAATDDHRQRRADNDRAMPAHQYCVLVG